jgi:hypothetical protein
MGTGAAGRASTTASLTTGSRTASAATVAQLAFDAAVVAALAAGLDPHVALQRALNAQTGGHA